MGSDEPTYRCTNMDTNESTNRSALLITHFRTYMGTNWYTYPGAIVGTN